MHIYLELLLVSTSMLVSALSPTALLEPGLYECQPRYDLLSNVLVSTIALCALALITLPTKKASMDRKG